MAKNFYNGIKGIKVKEVPEHVKPMLSMNYLKSTIKSGLDNYHAKYIQTSSIDPLYHVCFGGMALSYPISSTSSTPKNTAAIDLAFFWLSAKSMDGLYGEGSSEVS